MMRLRATIREIRGNAAHYVGAPVADMTELSKVPDPVAVEIVEQDGSYLLLRLDDQGR